MYDNVLPEVRNQILKYTDIAVRSYGIACDLYFCNNENVRAMAIPEQLKLVFNNSFLFDITIKYITKSQDPSLFCDDLVRNWMQKRIEEIYTIESVALLLVSHEYAHLLDHRTYPENIHLLVDAHDDVFIALWTDVYNKLKEIESCNVEN